MFHSRDNVRSHVFFFLDNISTGLIIGNTEYSVRIIKPQMLILMTFRLIEEKDGVRIYVDALISIVLKCNPSTLFKDILRYVCSNALRMND